MFKRKGGGVKGFLNNVKKNYTFLARRLPLTHLVPFGKINEDNLAHLETMDNTKALARHLAVTWLLLGSYLAFA